jgi:tetratricopeptide (TPR) repeat protein
VLARAGGVPFFLVTWAQATNPEDGDAGGGEAVPWDVAQDIRRRVAALSPAARDLLGVAAVIGRAAAYALLATVSALPDTEAIAALDAACRARLLVDAGEGYLFAHDVIREVVEADLGAARRTVFHRRVAEALARGPARVAAAVLAYHYRQGGVLDAAVGYLEQAGAQARAQGACAAAAGYDREAVEGLDTLGRTDDAAALRATLGRVLLTLGQPDDALAVLEAAARACRTPRDGDRLGEVTALIAQAEFDRGRGEEGLQRIAVMLAVLAPHGPSSGLAALATRQARLLLFLGRFAEQQAAAERAVELARMVGDALLLAQAHEQRTLGLYHLGQREQWLGAMQDMPRLAEAAGDATLLSNTLNGLAVVAMLNGDFDRSRAYNARSIAVAEQLGDPALLGHRLGLRGFIAIYTGEWAQARVDIARELAMSRALHAPSMPALIKLGTLCLMEGAWNEASRHLEEAVAHARRLSYHEGSAWAERLLAERDLLEGRPAAAQSRLVALLESSTNDEHDHAFLLPSLAWAALQSGDADQAGTVAAAAVARAQAEQNRLALAEALRVCALAAMARQQWDAAVASLDDGLAMTRQIRYPYGEGRLLHVYGLLHVQRHELELARERLAAARALFRHLGARRDIEQVEQILIALPDG